MSYKLNGIGHDLDATTTERIDRLERKHGLRADAAQGDIVERIGDDLWALGGRAMTTEELDAELDKQRELADADMQLRRDLNLDAPQVEGDALHKQAVELLHARGIHAPSAAQLLEMYCELGAE